MGLEMPDSSLNTNRHLCQQPLDDQDSAADHCERVARYALAIAGEMGLSEDEKSHLRCAAMLHDLGKIRLSPRTLRIIGTLTEGELSVMRRHSVLAFKILERADEFKSALPAVKHHDERYDGQGPTGLAGQDIPLPARILAVAEAYDILTTDVPWRDAMEPKEALRQLRRAAGTQFDPDVLAALHRTFKESFSKAA